MPIFRGRKLVLNYTDGSPCDDDGHSREREVSSRATKSGRRKSSVFSFLCDRDPTAAKVHVSFIGASPDQCTYFFEARTLAACGGVIAPQQSLGAGSVFGVIAIIAAAVYVLGGIAYQRTVMHQRGWRQLPNYSLWASIFGFVSVGRFPSSRNRW